MSDHAFHEGNITFPPLLYQCESSGLLIIALLDKHVIVSQLLQNGPLLVPRGLWNYIFLYISIAEGSRLSFKATLQEGLLFKYN